LDKPFNFSDRLLLPDSKVGRFLLAAFLGIVLGVTLVPASSVPVWMMRDMVLRVLSVAAFIALLCSIRPQKGNLYTLEWDLLDGLMAFGMVWVSLSAWNSDHSYESFYACRGFLAIILWWFIFRVVWRKWPELFGWFLSAFLGISLVAAFWVIFGTALNHMNPWARPFPNENFAAAFLSIALTVSVLRWFRQPRWPSAVPAILFFTAWAFMKSRGGFLAVAVALGFFLLWNHERFESLFRKWKTKEWLVLAGVVLLLLLPSYKMINRLMTVGDKDDRAYDRATVIWGASLQMALPQPVMGFGPGTYGTVFPYYRPARRWYLDNDYAHNEFLQAAVEGGWPMAAWAFALAAAFGWGFLRLKKPASPFVSVPLSDEVAAWTGPLLALFIVWASLDFVLHEWSVAFTGLAFLTFAFRRPVDLGWSLSVRFKRPQALLAAVGLSLALLGGVAVGGFRDFLAGVAQLRGIRAQQEGDVATAAAYFRQSVRIRPRNPHALLASAAAEEVLASGQDDPAIREQLLRSAEDGYRKAVEVAPLLVAAKSDFVEFWQRRNRLDLALDLQKKLTGSLPDYLPNYFNLGLIFLDLGKPHEAISQADQAIQRKGNYQPAYLLKGMAFEKLGQPGNAVRAYRDGLDLRPESGEKDVTSYIVAHLAKPAPGRAAAKP